MPNPISIAYIPGTAERYMVTSDGRVLDRHKGCKLVSQTDDGKGYLVVKLHMENGAWRTARVHRLVAENFVSGRTGARRVVNHLNENPHDNRSENLAWVTYRENLMWHGAHLRGAAKRSQRILLYTENNSFYMAFPSLRAAAASLGVNCGSLSHVIRGERKTVRGMLARTI